MRRIIFISFLAMLLLLMSACSDKKTEEVSPQGVVLQGETDYPKKIPHFGVTTSSKAANVILDRLCWEKPNKKCDIEHVKDFDGLFLGKTTMSVTPREEIFFSHSSPSDVPKELWGLDNIQIDLVQNFKGEKSQVEHDGKSFNAPEEPGRYYYSAKITWINDIKGEASYAFAVIVK